MRRALAIWLTISTPIFATATEPANIIDKVRSEHPELFTAPPLPGLSKSLPLPRRCPQDCSCEDAEGLGLGAGVWLPWETSQALDTQREQCKRLPGQSQARIDAIVAEVGAELRGVATHVADVATTTTDVDELEPAPRWSLWDVVSAATVGLVVGGVAGAVAGWRLSQ